MVRSIFDKFTGGYKLYKYPIEFFVASASFILVNVKAEGVKYGICGSDIDILLHLVHAHGAVMKRLQAQGESTMTFLETYKSYDRQNFAESLEIGMDVIVGWDLLNVVASEEEKFSKEVRFLTYNASAM
jgi:hypothetical protein